MKFFRYRFTPTTKPLLRILGVRADRDGVRVADGLLTASFGFFSTDVAIANIGAATVTGPYRWFKAVGPRLSLADHGLTFGTNAAKGVCITFITPIESMIGPWAHPGLTLTVDDPEGLIAAITEGRS